MPGTAMACNATQMPEGSYGGHRFDPQPLDRAPGQNSHRAVDNKGVGQGTFQRKPVNQHAARLADADEHVATCTKPGQHLDRAVTRPNRNRRRIAGPHCQRDGTVCHHRDGKVLPNQVKDFDSVPSHPEGCAGRSPPCNDPGRQACDRCKLRQPARLGIRPKTGFNTGLRPAAAADKLVAKTAISVAIAACRMV